ncbi:hypothetical protein ATCC90586_005451 [Pythium insidiosum]|nr:hypothetical protein ATCC90586_005451 [Pythium insidiosum]
MEDTAMPDASASPLDAAALLHGLALDRASASDVRPLLPLLTRVHEQCRPPARRDRALHGALRVDDPVLADELCAYAAAVASLTPQDLATQPDEGGDRPLYRRFEDASAAGRARLVLQHVLGDAPATLADDELFRQEIYRPHVVAIVVNALAADALAPSFRVDRLVGFCLSASLGVELLEGVVRNDPLVLQDVLSALASRLHGADSDELGSAALLPATLRHAVAACGAIAALSPFHARRVLSHLTRQPHSVAAAFAAFQLLVEQPALRSRAAAIVLQWMKQDAATAGASGLATFLRVALGADPRSDPEGAPPSERPHAAPTAAAFLEEAQFVMSQFRQQLVDDITQAQLESLDGLVLRLHVLLGLLLVGGMRPDEHETTQLLRCFDRVSKDLGASSATAAKSARLVSLMFIALLASCAPSAANLSKIPSQRDDATRLVLSLSQQCVYALYNTKAACPLLVLSAVLLFTKSPSLLPFLSSFLGDTFAAALLGPTAAIRVEQWFVVGDVVLKPILTEQVMAREVLTTFPVVSDSAGAMDEITLRCLHGLLAEKSFLRHHHGRKLEERLTEQLQHPPMPELAPLMVSILLEFVENYVMAFEYPIAHRPVLQLAILPLGAASVARVLRGADRRRDATAMASAVLALVYSLQFNQRMRQASAVVGSKLHAFVHQPAEEPTPAAAAATGQHSTRADADIIVSYDLDNAVPFGQIAAYAVANSSAGEPCEYVAPILLRLLAEEYPQHLPRTADPVRRVRTSRRRHMPQLLLQGRTEELPTVSWLDATLWLDELTRWPSRELAALIQRDVLGCLVPLAVLAVPSSLSAPTANDPEPFLSAFLALLDTRLSTETSDYTGIQTQLLQALSVPHLVWERYKQQQDVGHAGAASRSRRHVDSVWIPRTELVERPFSLLQSEALAVASNRLLVSPSLLALVLRLVLEARDEAIFVQRRRDASWLRHPPQAGEANGAAGVGAPATASHAPCDATTQQFLLVQDCLLVHALLARLQDALRASNGSVTEAVTRLTAALEQVMARPPLASGGASLVLTVHLQGYDVGLVPHVVALVPSVKQLWLHWIQQSASSDASSSHNGKGAADRRPGNAAPSSAGPKALTDFVAEASAERDATKWRFRLAVFFALCDRFFVPSQSSVVLPTIKQILQRLRVLVVASTTSGGGGGGGAGGAGNKNLLPAFASFREPAGRAAFLDDVLRQITTGCVRHPEIRTEVAQFLLNLKKHVAAASSALASAGAKRVNGASASATAGDASVAHAPLDMDQVVQRAYQRVLSHVG